MGESTLRALKTDQRKKAYKTVKGRKLAHAKAARRMAGRKRLSGAREAGDLGANKIIFAGGKLFRAAEDQGGAGQNCCV